MLLQEAEVIRDWVGRMDLKQGDVCLNLGSSTKRFREVTQPVIHSHIIGPIERTGCRVIHCDLKPDDGVDEVGDLLNADFQRRLIDYDPDLVICTNLLEHLRDPGGFASACGTILKKGGHCLFTVPSSFPYHPDPIDTMYRPAPAELAKVLPGWKVIASADVEAGNLREEIAAEPNAAASLVRQVARAAMPFYRPKQWYPAAHKLLWLFRRYRVAAVLLQKPA